jgi:hypothetical protein
MVDDRNQVVNPNPTPIVVMRCIKYLHVMSDPEAMNYHTYYTIGRYIGRCAMQRVREYARRLISKRLFYEW